METISSVVGSGFQTSGIRLTKWGESSDPVVESKIKYLGSDHSCQVKKVELLSISEYAQKNPNENENHLGSGRGKRQSEIAFSLSV